MACWFSVRPFQGEERVSRHERFYRIDQLLNQHGVVSFETLQAALEVSRATLKRDLQFLRDRFHAPIVTTGTRAATVSSVAASRPARTTSCRACGSRRGRFMRC